MRGLWTALLLAFCTALSAQVGPAAAVSTAASSGCTRMLNEEVIELYDYVRIGTKVIVV